MADLSRGKIEEAGLERYRVVLQIGALLVLLYIFFLGLDLMGLSFKLFGKSFATRLIQTTSNPFVGLFVGLLATSLVQSSSTTTSIIVAMVGAEALSVQNAIPIVMGANIGTSVTNTLVSLAHVSRPEEFRRAFAGATVHDFFNWLAVLILLPLELAVGYLATVADYTERLLEGVGGIKLLNPIKAIVEPVSETLIEWMDDSAVLTLILGILFLFFALRYLVTALKAFLSDKAERVLHQTLFRSAWAAIFAGLVITVMVQSSSITTSLMVPLLGAGVVTLEQVFPFTVGANVGTTITAILASLSIGTPPAVTIALTHLAFNITGGVIIYGIPPVRAIPLSLSRWMGALAVRNRSLAIAYIVLAFFGIPLLLIVLSGALGSDPPAPPAGEPAQTSALTAEDGRPSLISTRRDPLHV